MTDEINQQLHDYLYEMNHAEFERLKKSVMPSRFFKYRDFGVNFKYTIDALENDYVYMSRVGTFNDPLDSQMMIDPEVALEIYNASDRQWNIDAMFQMFPFTEEEKYEIQASEKPEYTVNDILKRKFPNEADRIQREFDEMFKGMKAHIERIVENYNKLISDYKYVHCLSTVNDSIPMWAYYGANQSGFCVEYDFSVLPDHHPAVRNCYPVFYRPSIFDLTQIFDSRGASPNVHLAASLTKTLDWKHENEWRITLMIEPPNFLKDNRLPVSPAVAIYLGERAGGQDVDQLIELARTKNMKLYKMTTSKGRLVAHELLS